MKQKFYSKVFAAILLLTCVICAGVAYAESPPMPHSISGTIFLADGITQAAAGTHYSINDTAGSIFVTGISAGTPPLFTNTGKYGAIIEGVDGDTIIVKVWNANNYGETTVTLSGTMTDVNVKLNKTYADIIPPAITNVHASAITNQSANIAWNTDENANSTLLYGTTTALGMSIEKTVFEGLHTIALLSLSNNTLYYYAVKSCDIAGNCGQSLVYNFTTLQNTASQFTDDTNPNYIRGTITMNGNPANSGKHYTVTVTSGVNNGFSYTGSIDDAKVPSFLYGNGFYSTGDLTGFSTGDTFHIVVDGCAATATGIFATGGNGHFASSAVNIECAATDTTAPVISNILVSSITNSSAQVSWSTDDNSTSVVSYGITAGLGTNTINSTLLTMHSIKLTGLNKDTIYYYKVKSCNEWALCQESSQSSFTTLSTVLDSDGDGFNTTVDCDDTNPLVHPLATEHCNGIDDNCNGIIDEENSVGCTAYYYDNDSDSYGTTDSKCLCAPSGKYTATQNSDCNDNNPSIHPGATEVCGNTIDENCDGSLNQENGNGCTVFYKDNDQDNYGTAESKCYCMGLGNYTSSQSGDCNDTNPNISPGKQELCNGIDDNCNGIIDEENSVGCTAYYFDNDSDSYGTTDSKCLCAPSGKYTATQNSDCNDNNPLIHPGAIEVCGNAIDENCDGSLNQENGNGCTVFYKDNDQDNYGTAESKCYCMAFGNYTASQSGDCNDTNPNISPGKQELCNGIDDNCNSQIDENSDSSCGTGNKCISGSCNHPPVLNPIGNKIVAEGSLLAFTVSATDIDGNSITYSAFNLPTGAVFDSATRAFSFTPDYDQSGTYTNIRFEATDNTFTVSEVISITVSDTNRPPVFDDLTEPAQHIDEDNSIEFMVYAIDPDDDLVTISTSTLPYGSSYSSTTHLFSWTPEYNQAGTYPITFTATDGKLNVARIITIYVHDINRAPVIDPIANQEVNEGQALTVQASAIDPDDDVLTYSLVGSYPTGMTINPVTGLISFTPTYDQSGTYAVVVRARDASLHADASFNIVVGNANRQPVLLHIGNKQVNENSTLSFIVLATDPDMDSITYSASNIPAGSSFDAVSHTFTWKPDFSQSGTFSNVRFIASDGILEASENITITVNDVNRNPIFTSVPNTAATELSAYSYQAIASDADLDTLTYSLDLKPTGMVIDSSTGLISWTPQDLHSKVSTNRVVIRVSDSKGGFALQDYIILVTDINQNPAITSIPGTAATESSPYAYQVTATDPDSGDILSYSLIQSPEYMNISTSGKITWTPADNDAKNSPVSVIVRVSDNHGGFVEQAYSIQITDINQAPLFVSSPITMATEGTMYSYQPSVIDPDYGDIIQFSLVVGPDGMAINAATGLVTWTPDYYQYGSSKSVVIKAMDQLGLFALQSYSISVSNTNRIPVLNSIGSKTIDENSTLEFVVSASDDDTDDTLTYHAAGLPDGAMLSLTTGVFSWKPNFEQTGNYMVHFSVVDEWGANDSEDVEIIVNNVNRMPLILPIGTKNAAEGELLSFSISATDPDGNALTYFAEMLPEGALFDASSRTFTWTPAYNQQGDYDVVFGATDGNAVAREHALIIISNTNRPPVIAPVQDQTVVEGNVLEFMLSATDPDGDAVVYSGQNLPSGMLIDPVTGKVSFVPLFSQSGTYIVTFRANDALSVSSTTAKITVTEYGNHAPVFTPIGNKSVTEGNTLSFTISATDIDGDNIIYGVDALPIGALFDANSRTFTWTPTYMQSGEYSMLFTASDGLASAFETMTIIVFDAGNQKPVLEPIATITVTEGELVSVYPHATDSDGNEIVFGYSAPLNSSGQWQTKKGDAGTYTATVTATDGSLTDSKTVTIIVKQTPFQELYWGRADILNEYLQAGDDLMILVSVQNSGNMNMKGTEVTVVVQELGISKHITIGTVKAGNDASNTFILPIPYDAPAGTYDARITVNNGNVRRVKVRQFTII